MLRDLRGHLKKTGCSDRWGRPAKAATAIATLLKRKAAGVHQRAHLLEIKLARSPPGPKPKWK